MIDEGPSLIQLILALHGSLSRLDQLMPKGPSIYDVHTEGEGVRLKWTHVYRGKAVKPHVDVHTEN